MWWWCWCWTELHHPRQTLDPERGIIKPRLATGQTMSQPVTSVTLHVPRRAWLRDGVSQTRPLHCTGILSMKDWLHIAATRHWAGGVIRPFVLVSPFFLWSRWPRARSQVLRMLRIYLAIRELQTNTQLHRYTLHCYRCMHVIYDVLTIIWNAGYVTRSFLIYLKGWNKLAWSDIPVDIM